METLFFFGKQARSELDQSTVASLSLSSVLSMNRKKRGSHQNVLTDQPIQTLMSLSQGLYNNKGCNQKSLDIHFYIKIHLFMYINIDIYPNSHSYVNHHLYVLIHLKEILKERWGKLF